MEAIDVSLDIKEFIPNYLDLLESVDEARLLYEGPVLQEAVRRYLVLWLPLIADSEDRGLLRPPLDIHWVWCCHALSPLRYKEDIQNAIGCEYHHCWIPHRKRQKAIELASQIWNKRYPDEPFLIDKDIQGKTMPGKYDSLAKILYECANNERHFYYQVSLPQYHKDSILEEALMKYRHFLNQVKKNPSKVSEVSTDIELIWRTHILQSKTYSEDCVKWFGKLLDHFSTMSTVKTSTANGVSDVRVELHSSNAGSGCSVFSHINRRGESPVGRAVHLSEEDRINMSAKVCKMSIEEILIEGYRIESKGVKLSVSIELSGKRDNHQVSKSIAEFTGSHYDPEEKKAIVFSVDPERYDSITLKITKKSGSVLKSGKTSQGQHTFDLIPLIETCPNIGTPFSESGSFKIKDLTVHVSMRGSITPSDRGIITLSQIPGNIDEDLKADTDDDLQNILEKSGKTKSEIRHLRDVTLSTHRFINRGSRLIFTCKHYQKAPNLSLVQVWFQGSLVAEGNIIPSDTLPRQKIPDIPYLVDNESGFVIKNSVGDWGILVATPMPESESIQQGTSMRLYTVSPVSKVWSCVRFQLPNEQGDYIVEISGFCLNLRTGKVTISKSCSDVAEAVAVSYGIATLFALTWRAVHTTKKTPGAMLTVGARKTWNDELKAIRMISSIKL